MRQIVILGAGFGGLRAATQIAKKLKRLGLNEKYGVTLVDRSDCHLYTPLLYKAAASPTARKEACAYGIESLVAGNPIRFVRDEVAEIDLLNGDIRLKKNPPIKADFLVIALGSETNYFGIPGLKEISLQLKTLEDALRIKKAVGGAFKKGGKVKVVVGGAGSNGVELASEIRLWADKAEKENKDLNVEISLLEAMPAILPGLDEEVARRAAKRLDGLRVKVLLNRKVVSVAPREIAVENEEKIPFDVFVWTGGIKSPEILLSLPVQKEPRGRPLAESGMACLPAAPNLKLYPKIYGLGDSVCFIDPETKRPAPAVARAAIQQAGVAAHNLLADIVREENESGKTSTDYGAYASYRTYKPWGYPYVIPVGGRWAVARVGPLVISGFPGWILKELVELNYLLSIMRFWRAIKIWLKGLWIFAGK